MKKFFFSYLLGFLGIAPSLTAQVEVKINPIGLLIGRATANVEMGITPKVGVEASVGYNYFTLTYTDDNQGREAVLQNRTYRLMLNGRYYFNTKKGLDRFFLGAYGRYTGGSLLGKGEHENEVVTHNRLAAGMLIGYKAVTRNQKFVFDFNLGLGYAPFNKYAADGTDIDLSEIPILKMDIPASISIGYRFGGSTKK